MFRRSRLLRPRGTYTDWWWPEPAPREVRGYTSLEHVLTPEVDPGPETTYFWAHQFRTVWGEGGYLGLQTKGNRADGSLGKMAIFSFWDTLAAEGPGAVRFGGEGTGWSCRIPYYWQPGKPYRLAVALVATEADRAWWAASVADEEAGDEAEIGLICAPLRWGGLGTWSVMWTEYYGGPLARCEDLPYSRVVFSRPAADAGAVAPQRSSDHLGDGDCGGSRVTRVGDGVRHEMGLLRVGDG